MPSLLTRRSTARGSASSPRPLSRAGREEIAAVTLYLVAYSARAHALGRRGDFVEALERFGAEYLAL